MTAPLTIRQLSKYYGKQIGVQDISLQLKPGEVFGFLGPNGAGKTTTIRAVLDFIRPSHGAIEIFGHDSRQDTPSWKRRVGYLAGDIALYQHMSGRQHVQYLYGLGQPVDWEYVAELTDLLQVQLDRPAKSLSKGNRQKLGLLLAFMHRPDLYLLDEPTSGLDPLMQQTFYRALENLKREGRTVFLSSHNLHEVQRLCDRAAFIRDGRLIAIEDIQAMRRLNLRRYTIRFRHQAPVEQLQKTSGVSEVVVDKADAATATLTMTGAPDELFKLLAESGVEDLSEVDTSLEEVFMHYYEE